MLQLALACAMATLGGLPEWTPHDIPEPRWPDASPPWRALEVPDCRARLEALGYAPSTLLFSRTSVTRARAFLGLPPRPCHIPQPMTILRAPRGLAFNSQTFVNCTFAIALARLEVVVEEEARRVFADPPVEADPAGARALTLLGGGTYNCRFVRGKKKLSQHAFGNAIDIRGFRLRGLGVVSVLDHWTPRSPSHEPASRFLRALAQRLRSERIFSNVLDPDSDASHRDHIHADLAPCVDGLPSDAFRVHGLPAPLVCPPPDPGPTAPGAAEAPR
jgi:hypothetical protein